MTDPVQTGENWEIGTVRWFGASWGAPACIPEAQVPVPDQACAKCGVAFHEDSQGVKIPHTHEGGWYWEAYHLSCWLDVLGLTRDKEQADG